MVILRQENLLVYLRSKAKFVPCWAILSHDPQIGPTLALYEDNTAKRAIEEKLPLAGMASGIRFGSTSWSHLDASIDIGQFTKDPRVDKSLLIALLSVPERTGGGGAKKARIGPIWLCSYSLQQFYEFIRALSESLTSFGLPAPNRRQVESPDALHNQKPRSFAPANEWEQFWDSPSPFVPQKPIIDTIKSVSTLNLSSGTTMDGGTLHGFKSEMTTSTIPSTTKSTARYSINMDKMGGSRMNLNLGDNLEEQAMPILCRYKELPEQPFRKYVAESRRQSTNIGIGPNNVEKKREIMATNIFGNDGDMQNRRKNSTPNSSFENQQNGNEITVIQLLDDAIEEGGKMPAPPIPNHRNNKYMDAEIQTEETMATAGFWSLLVATAANNNASELADDDGAEKKRRASEANGNRRLVSYPSISSDYDPCEGDEALGEQNVEVCRMDEVDTRFYRVQLAQIDGKLKRKATMEEEEDVTQF